MFKKAAHAVAVVTLHLAVLLAAHHLTEEIIVLVKDELSVDATEAMLALFKAP